MAKVKRKNGRLKVRQLGPAVPGRYGGYNGRELATRQPRARIKGRRPGRERMKLTGSTLGAAAYPTSPAAPGTPAAPGAPLPPQQPTQPEVAQATGPYMDSEYLAWKAANDRAV